MKKFPNWEFACAEISNGAYHFSVKRNTRNEILFQSSNYSDSLSKCIDHIKAIEKEISIKYN